MAQITVDTDVAVLIDGSLRYRRTEPHFINDTAENKKVALDFVNKGLITIVVDFVIVEAELEIANDNGNPLAIDFNGTQNVNVVSSPIIEVTNAENDYLNVNVNTMPSVTIGSIPSVSLNSGTNTIGNVKITDGSNFGDIDILTSSLTTIDVGHRKVHRGDSFIVFVYFSLAAGATSLFHLKTNNVKLIHAKPPIFQTDGPKIYFEFIENPTLTQGTIPISIFNRNRNSATTSQLQIFSNPTGVSGGTIVDITYLGGGSGGQGVNASATGSNYSSDEELILKTNTNYIGKVVNNFTETSTILVKFIWYETNVL